MAKTNKNSAVYLKKLVPLTIKLLYMNPNILSLARNIPVQHQDIYIRPIWQRKTTHFYFLNTSTWTVLRRALRSASTDRHTHTHAHAHTHTVVTDLFIQTHSQPCIGSK